MIEKYKTIMNEMGYNHLVCDIFDNWEDVKDEILLPERKDGSGNGTVHVFLGNADNVLRNEFSTYYDYVKTNGDVNKGAVVINHYFLKSNIYSMIGAMCKYCYAKKIDFSRTVEKIFKEIENEPSSNGLFHTTSLFKLSIGSSKLRPYFKQFESDGIFHKVIRLLLVPKSAYKIYLLKNDNGDYAAFWLIGFNDLEVFEVDSTCDNLPTNKKISQLSYQQIYYGAPGTGKSHRIKKELKEMNVPNENILRTTFHPDSDYSSFVGAYKPTMKSVDYKYKAVVGKDEEIAYAFVPQTFIKAYTRAYNKPDENIYLIIEEINRGNCAQIFGDLFQLLDRDENGVSEYPIKADSDLRTYLEGDLGVGHEGIKDGELCLPSNLYIWATMNTSDQSLFPIDSAFKRRWDWEYEPIKYKNTDWVIEIGDNNYLWTSFQRIINDKIFEATSSEDKMLGDYFVKPCNNVISEKQFINKVLFYLWNDVCKDGDGDIFRTEDNQDVKFSDLYNEYGTNTLQSMMKYLGVQLLSDEIIEDVEDFVDNTEINELNNNVDINNSYSAQQEYGNKFDYSKYSLNGSGSYSKGAVVYEAVKLYCNNHREQNAEDIVRQWLGLGIKVPNLIETESVHANRKENTRDAHFDEKSKQLQLANGQTIYVSNQFNVERITDFTTKVNAQSWGIRIEKI